MKIITTFMLLFGSLLLLGCDNSNDDVPPPPDPGHVKVFVTSGAYTGILANGSGLDGADATCTDVAAKAGQTGTWTAWLSDNATDAAGRIFDGNVRYQLINGTVIADNMADLLDGTLDAPILIDESGNDVVGAFEVWTGTFTDGTNSGADSCTNWTVNNPTQRGLIGRADNINGSWTSVFADNCGIFNRLYCFARAVSP